MRVTEVYLHYGYFTEFKNSLYVEMTSHCDIIML